MGTLAMIYLGFNHQRDEDIIHKYRLVGWIFFDTVALYHFVGTVTHDGNPSYQALQWNYRRCGTWLLKTAIAKSGSWSRRVRFWLMRGCFRASILCLQSTTSTRCWARHPERRAHLMCPRSFQNVWIKGMSGKTVSVLLKIYKRFPLEKKLKLETQQATRSDGAVGL